MRIETHRSPAQVSHPSSSLHSDIVTDGSGSSKLILSCLFVILIVVYAGVGRDLFFNRLASAGADDPIGAYLVYVRCLVGFSCIVLVSLRRGSVGTYAMLPWIFLPFIALILLSASWVDDPKDVTRETIQFSVFITALFLCCHDLGSKTVFRLLCGLCAFAIVMSTIVAIFIPSIGRHSGFEIVQYSHAGRWKGIFSHKNSLGPWAAICLFLYAILLLNRAVPIMLGSIVVACSLSCLLFSESATSLIVALSMVFIYGILMTKRAVSTELFWSAATVLFIVGASLYFFVLDDLFVAFGRSSDLTGRTDLWSIAIDVFFEAPFLGQGYGLAGGKVFNELASGLVGSSTVGPESGYLVTVLETGIVGVLLFFVPLIYFLICGFRLYASGHDRHKNNQTALCIALGVFVLAYTEATALGPTSSVGSFCLSWFVVLLVAREESKAHQLTYGDVRRRLPDAKTERGRTPEPYRT